MAPDTPPSDNPPDLLSDPPFNTAETDRLLSTTRAVRRRLDLNRPVPPQILLDCIDLAEQAPTGGNQSSRRWRMVNEQERGMPAGT